MRNFMKLGLILFMMFPPGIKTSAQEWSGTQEIGKPTVKISISPAEPTTKDMITFTVDAQDHSMTGLKRIIILVNDREVKVCLMSPCSFFGGPYPEGPLKYGAKVFDHTNNEPSTGFRTISVKGPSSSSGSPKRIMSLLPLAENVSTRWADGYVALPFPGQEDDLGSFACFRLDALLEDDKVYSKVILTHPQWRGDIGLIVGILKIENLPEKATFRTSMGFLKEANQTDGAEFRVFVDKDPSFYASERCEFDGRLDDLTLDLGRYSGQDVDLVLQVRFLNTAAPNLAAWVNPRIEW